RTVHRQYLSAEPDPRKGTCREPMVRNTRCPHLAHHGTLLGIRVRILTLCCLGCEWPILRLLGYLAARDQYWNDGADIPDGLCYSKLTESGCSRHPTQA